MPPSTAPGGGPPNIDSLMFSETKKQPKTLSLTEQPTFLHCSSMALRCGRFRPNFDCGISYRLKRARNHCPRLDLLGLESMAWGGIVEWGLSGVAIIESILVVTCSIAAFSFPLLPPQALPNAVLDRELVPFVTAGPWRIGLGDPGWRLHLPLRTHPCRWHCFAIAVVSR